MLDIPTSTKSLRALADRLWKQELHFPSDPDLLNGLADVLENLDGKELTIENLLEAAERALLPPTEETHFCIYCHAATINKDTLCTQCRYELGS